MSCPTHDLLHRLWLALTRFFESHTPQFRWRLDEAGDSSLGTEDQPKRLIILEVPAAKASDVLEANAKVGGIVVANEEFR